MKSTTLYEDQKHQWIMFGRDPDKPEKIIDTNQYMIKAGDEVILLDPGGIEIFPSMLAAILRHCELENIHALFSSHQDPDICSSLGQWDQILPDGTKLHAPWLWEGFIRHFGCERITYAPIQDEGGSISLNGLELRFIPAHFLHASGNYHVYDPVAKILMSGDIGAALEKADSPMFVEDFDAHTQHMTYFHQRWMPSNSAKNDWVQRIRELDIEMMAPQHGRIFKGDDVKRFLDWFEELEVGILGAPK